MKIVTQEISSSLLSRLAIRLFVKRLDQLDSPISGNKWFKLKYNLIEANKMGLSTLLTFGGAYSNHILATSFAAKEYGMRSIGVIRGDKHFPLNPTLDIASKNGMKLYYVSREDYRLRTNNDFLERLKIKFGDFYLIPEGGSNKLAVQGTSEILDKKDQQDYICCSVGTGGTISGIINSSNDNQIILGFPVIKDLRNLRDFISALTYKDNYKLIRSSSFSSYADMSEDLVEFITQFYISHGIILDVIYTGRMMFSIFELINQNYFEKESTILALHTGGIQGNKGANKRFGINLPVED